MVYRSLALLLKDDGGGGGSYGKEKTSERERAVSAGLILGSLKFLFDDKLKGEKKEWKKVIHHKSKSKHAHIEQKNQRHLGLIDFFFSPVVCNQS